MYTLLPAGTPTMHTEVCRGIVHVAPLFIKTVSQVYIGRCTTSHEQVKLELFGFNTLRIMTDCAYTGYIAEAIINVRLHNTDIAQKSSLRPIKHSRICHWCHCYVRLYRRHPLSSRQRRFSISGLRLGARPMLGSRRRSLMA